MASDDLVPLHDVPIAFKDLTATKGTRTTMGGCYMFENHAPDEDAAVVSRLESAGMQNVGRRFDDAGVLRVGAALGRPSSRYMRPRLMFVENQAA
jgi:Asp-tRNA(Asn)/Glu-tRNA(Gln) amidotransferase A subunit family amidase